VSLCVHICMYAYIYLVFLCVHVIHGKYIYAHTHIYIYVDAIRSLHVHTKSHNACRVAVCCSVLRVLQCFAACCSVLQCVQMQLSLCLRIAFAKKNTQSMSCCSVLQRVARITDCCSVLQCVAVTCIAASGGSATSKKSSNKSHYSTIRTAIGGPS